MSVVKVEISKCVKRKDSIHKVAYYYCFDVKKRMSRVFQRMLYGNEGQQAPLIWVVPYSVLCN